MNDPLLRLSLLFLQMSLLAFGGAYTILPELRRQGVEQTHMMDAHTFASLFALAQAEPDGGQPDRMACRGVGGAVLTMICMLAPSSVLAFMVTGAWYRFRDAPWRRATQKGLLLVTAGLLIKATTLDWSLGMLTAVITILPLTTKVHPMLVLGAAVGLVG